MNQTVAHTQNPVPATLLNFPGHDSLISKIMERLKTIAKSRFAETGTAVQHQSYMDANLLDETVGPEISRSLRR